MGPQSVASLEVWRDAIKLVTDLYAATGKWPKDELFGLTVQVRRAAVSIPANIAEGVGRGTGAETARFVRIAQGSAYELDTLVRLATELGLISADAAADLADRIDHMTRRLAKLAAYKQRAAP